MILAELEVWHSRPIAPTRRVAVGRALLPCDPAPGFGGVLLGAVCARFAPELDPELLPDVGSLTHELTTGRRIPQPRLRHRFQQDRVGLSCSVQRLHGCGECLSLDLTHRNAAPAQLVLAAVYAAGRLDPVVRPAVMEA
ncbi:MAG: hypothetical protein ACE5GB_14195, partial [Acidimicrobiales bacterium]